MGKAMYHEVWGNDYTYEPSYFGSKTIIYNILYYIEVEAKSL